MQKRVNITQREPQALSAMMGLETYLSNVTISTTLKNFIKIRASQINGCAYCIDMHSKEALEKGETNRRIFLLSAWREAGAVFSEEEKLVLTITEEVTLINREGLSDQTYEKALALFSENQIAEIVMSVIGINAWNRIAISSRYQLA